MASSKVNFPNTKLTIIYSLPQLFTGSTWEQLSKYESAWPELQAAGVDSMYCINSNAQSRLLAYYAGKFSSNTQPLPDLDQSILGQVKEHFSLEKDLHSLGKYWQYVLILRNGEPVKLISNPIRDNMPLRIVKSRLYQYHGLGPDAVLKYLSPFS